MRTPRLRECRAIVHRGSVFRRHTASYTRARYGGVVAGETDAGGGRRRALDEFLDARVAEGFRVEVREDTHAIVVQGGDSLVSRLLGRRRRFVVEVDDHGIASMRSAEPVRH
jgi:hypothetical protein